MIIILLIQQIQVRISKYVDFSGGTVGRDLPAKAGDMRLIPGQGKSHRLRNN